jgi:hypothetical protein
MPYGSLLADTVQSSSSSPVTFKNTSGTEIGTLCRAWVNFNGTGTVAIRASFNVSSITDNGTGDYTVNFTTALPDANYAVSVNNNGNYGTAQAYAASLNSSTPGTLVEVAPTTTACRFTTNATTGAFDPKYVNVAIFR